MKYKNLTPAQQEAFEAIATGASRPRMHPKVCKELLKRGLIVLLGMQRVGRDCLGPIELPVYEVPLHEHIAWCQWCSENFPDNTES